MEVFRKREPPEKTHRKSAESDYQDGPICAFAEPFDQKESLKIGEDMQASDWILPCRDSIFLQETSTVPANPPNEPTPVTSAHSNVSRPIESAAFDMAREPIEAAAQRAAELFVSIERGLGSRRVSPATTRI